AVAAFTATLYHPGAEQVASIRVDSVSVRVQDERRLPHPAGNFLDRVHVLWNDVEVATISDPSATSSVIGAHIGVPLNPGMTGQLSIVVDLQATAPQQFMEIVLDADAVNARDVNS